MAEEIEVRHGRSLRELLEEHGLRIAISPEDLGITGYALECRVCGETRTLVVSGTVGQTRCPTCGLDWAQAPPTFWVLVPKEKNGD